MAKLDGKIALVTGGSTGIGLATAKLFAAEGAQVYVTARRQKPLDAAVVEIGTGAIGVQGDAASLEDLDRLFAQIKRDSGKLDIVFANAALYETAPFGEIEEAHFDRMFNANVKGLLFSVQKALPLMPDGSSIVLTGSIVGSKGSARQTIHAAAKAAVRSFARTWTTDLKSRRIRVNVVSPGPVDTTGLRTSLGGHTEAGNQLIEGFARMVPLGRIGKPEEIAKAVLFLASEDSSFVSGIELFVDGGIAQV